MLSQPNIAQTLESVFRCIEQERMQDMPMCNPNLQVQAVGFQSWGEYYLGVMITPWFMNLMLLPQSDKTLSDMQQTQEGSKQTHVFPSGYYEFVNGREEGLGCYQVCSLFSPLLEFEQQSIVVEVAQSVLRELMQAENHDDISTHEKTIEKIWYPEGSDTDTLQTVAEQKTLDEKLAAPLSRREFLRGRREATRDVGNGD
jgi:[NiFe] hydrogenase assembly HybE family chaperone